MTQAVKTTLTLAVLVALLLLGLSWGWTALTEPLPDQGEAPTCVETAVREGDVVTPDQVTVTVLNAGRRAGLAGRTMAQLLDQGFHRGGSGNAPQGTAVTNAQIWTDDPESPAVQLLAARLDKVRIVQQDVTTWAGVVLVVGDGFPGVGDGPASVEVTRGTTICAPPTSAV